MTTKTYRVRAGTSLGRLFEGCLTSPVDCCDPDDAEDPNCCDSIEPPGGSGDIGGVSGSDNTSYYCGTVDGVGGFGGYYVLPLKKRKKTIVVTGWELLSTDCREVDPDCCGIDICAPCDNDPLLLDVDDAYVTVSPTYVYFPDGVGGYLEPGKTINFPEHCYSANSFGGPFDYPHAGCAANCYKSNFDTIHAGGVGGAVAKFAPIYGYTGNCLDNSLVVTAGWQWLTFLLNGLGGCGSGCFSLADGFVYPSWTTNKAVSVNCDSGEMIFHAPGQWNTAIEGPLGMINVLHYTGPMTIRVSPTPC